MALINKVTIPSIPTLPGSGLTWTGTDKSEKKTGTGKADLMFGMGGNDTLLGKGGNDIIDGNMGRDVIDGGAGLDTLTMLGADTLTGGSGKDFFVLVGIKYNMQLGSANTSVITDFQTSRTNGDVLNLGGFFKFKWANRDKDLNDNFAMTQKGKDVEIYTKDQGGNIQKILLKNVKLADLNEQNVMITKLPPGLKAADPLKLLVGTSADDQLNGNRQDNNLRGLAGDDTLRGFSGDDTLNGGAGADQLFGGAGKDLIKLSGGDTALGGVGADTFVLLSHDAQPKGTDAGNVVIGDFRAAGANSDKLDLSAFDLDWSARDKGLEDGFELKRIDGGTQIRIVDGDDIITLTLQGTRYVTLTRATSFSDLSPFLIYLQ